jgi:hypothetical protein
MPRADDDDRDDPPPRPRRRADDPGPRRRGPDRDARSDRDEPVGRKRARRPVREEDDEDDLPRRRPAKKGSNLPIILGVGAIAGLLLLSACGVGLYYLASPADSPKLGTKGPAPGAGGGAATMPGITLPAGWVEFNDPRNEIRLFWPGGQPTRQAAAGGAADTETWTQTYHGKKYTLVRSSLPAAEARPGGEAAALDNAVAGMLSALPGATEVRKNTEVEGGHRFRVSTIDIPQGKQRVFARLLVAKGRLIILTITAPQNNVFWATEPDTAPFFQSLWPK